MQKPYLLLGEIVRPQGVRGEVKVRHETDDPSRFEALENVYVEKEGRYEPLRVLKSRAQGDNVYLTLENVNDRDAAEKLRGVKLYIDRAHARQLGEDEFFIADLIGVKAVSSDGEEIGTLRDVMQSGAAPVLVFDTKRGTMMMPFVGRTVKDIDVQAGRMTLDAQTLDEVALYESESGDDE